MGMMGSELRHAAWCAGLVLVACGTDTEANLAAEIGWRFDYSDYTSGAPEDLRDCANNAMGSAITTVRLVAVDPAGQVQGFDTRYPCAEGFGSRVPIRGVTAGLFDLTAEARSGERVLYRYEERNVDLTGGVSRTLTLQATVGELRFRPLVEGSFDCDPSITQIDVEFFPLEDGAPALTPAVSFRTDEPCTGSFYGEIEIDEIPAVPTTGPSGFVLQRYEVRVTAASESAPLACATFERAIPPGVASAVGGDENLTAAACP